jgi:hypothetical protein
MGTRNLEEFKRDFESSIQKIKIEPKPEIITRIDVMNY